MSPTPNTPEDPSVARKGLSWTWGMTLGCIVYVATQSAVLGAVLPSLQGAWRFAAAGIWLWRSDPNVARGRVVLLFYLAGASWWALVMALASILLFVASAAITGKPPNRNALAAASLIVAGGWLLACLLSVVAFWGALRRRLRIWMHPAIRRELENNLMLIANSHRLWMGKNYAFPAIATTASSVVVAATMAFFFAALSFVDPMGGVSSPMVFLLLLLGGAFATLYACAWLTSRVVASRPTECWNFDVLPLAAIERKTRRNSTAWRRVCGRCGAPLNLDSLAPQNCWCAYCGTLVEPQVACFGDSGQLALDVVRIVSHPLPATRIAGMMLFAAIRGGFHALTLEPFEGRWELRAESLGSQATLHAPPREFRRSLPQVFKALAGMDVTEDRFPQAGALRLVDPGGTWERLVLVAVTPTEWGERVAIALPDWENLQATEQGVRRNKVRIA